MGSNLWADAYLEKHTESPRCLGAPMEYQTDNGLHVRVNDEHFSEIDVHEDGPPRTTVCGGPQPSYRVTATGFALLDKAGKRKQIDRHPRRTGHHLDGDRRRIGHAEDPGVQASHAAGP